MTTLRTFLLLPFHGIGHYNALFGVARALQKTHRVVFAGVGFFYQHVTSRGFEFRTLTSYPFGIGLETWVHETILRSKHPLWSNITDRWRDRLYHERKAELTKLLSELKPVHVLVDAQQATDVVVLKAIDPGMKVSIVSTAPPYLLLPGLPPVNSIATPQSGNNEIALARKESMRKVRSRAWAQKFRYFGMDDRTLVDRRLRRNKMMHLKDDYTSLISLAVKDVPTYILTYKEFDFHHPYLDRFQYVGPQAEINGDEAYRSETDMVRVYFSSGTVPVQRDIQGFLLKLREITNSLNYQLVVSSPTRLLNQDAVLSAADIFITHGGLNSIHDAMRWKVPMIVYPIDENYDQNGNASRVVYHGLGLRGDFDRDSIDDIRNKILAVRALKGNFDKFDPTSSQSMVRGYATENFIQKLLS